MLRMDTNGQSYILERVIVAYKKKTIWTIQANQETGLIQISVVAWWNHSFKERRLRLSDRLKLVKFKEHGQINDYNI